MKTIKIAFILSILISVSSCKQADANAEATTDPPPISTFDSPFPKNNKRLSNILGDSIMVKSFGDTLMLKITSNKDENLIINSKTGDTLFFGSICKYRDLYYFNQKLNDSSYYISAVKIKGNLIYGLNYRRWEQFYEVDNEIIKGNNKKLIKYINQDTTVIRLHPDKRELKNLFTSIINDVIPDTILNYDKANFNLVDKIESVTEVEQEDSNVLKVYPNPATDFINVELKHKNKSSFQLADLNGKTILQGQLNELVNKIDINNQQAGIYLLTINNLEKNKRETIKIAVK